MRKVLKVIALALAVLAFASAAAAGVRYATKAFVRKQVVKVRRQLVPQIEAAMRLPRTVIRPGSKVRRTLAGNETLPFGVYCADSSLNPEVAIGATVHQVAGYGDIAISEQTWLYWPAPGTAAGTEGWTVNVRNLTASPVEVEAQAVCLLATYLYASSTQVPLGATPGGVLLSSRHLSSALDGAVLQAGDSARNRRCPPRSAVLRENSFFCPQYQS